MLGYLFWTISDNWEWADGYGPKFGLVAVDRAHDLARKPRPSYHLFTNVVPFFINPLSYSLSLYGSSIYNRLIFTSGGDYRKNHTKRPFICMEQTPKSC